MKTLKLKHLAPYLPYGLNAKYHMLIDIKRKYDETIILSVTNIKWIIAGTHHKVILRPLSDLTKEIEHNGEKFVPEYWIDDKYGRNIDDVISDNRFVLELPYFIMQKFFEWHLDVFGLIEQGLAIDINTLDKELILQKSK